MNSLIEEMMLVKITGLKQEMFEMIRSIREIGVLHLSSPSDNISQLRDDELLEIYQQLQDVETRISVILTNLPPSKEEKEGELQDYKLLNPEALIEKGEALLKEIEPSLMKVQRSIRKLEDRNQYKYFTLKYFNRFFVINEVSYDSKCLIAQ